MIHFAEIENSIRALERMFKAFSQADSSTSRRFGGTGLGLAIVRDIIKRHHGTVDLDSRAETRFVVELPLAP